MGIFNGGPDTGIRSLVSSLTGRVSTNEGNISDLTSRVGSLESSSGGTDIFDIYSSGGGTIASSNSLSLTGKGFVTVNAANTATNSNASLSISINGKSSSINIPRANSSGQYFTQTFFLVFSTSISISANSSLDVTYTYVLFN